MVREWFTSKRKRGESSEALAATWLQNQGLSLLTRNYHCRHGEIDLIMQTADTLVFVEVRYRRNANFGGAAASVTSRKQQRLIAAARHYLASEPGRASQACRFDVLAMEPDQTGAVRYEWITNAFYGE